jgi:hypothetical protein
MSIHETPIPLQSMIPKKHALGLDPVGGNRFSEKIMLQDDG